MEKSSNLGSPTIPESAYTDNPVGFFDIRDITHFEDGYTLVEIEMDRRLTGLYIRTELWNRRCRNVRN